MIEARAAVIFEPLLVTMLSISPKPLDIVVPVAHVWLAEAKIEVLPPDLLILVDGLPELHFPRVLSSHP